MTGNDILLAIIITAAFLVLIGTYFRMFQKMKKIIRAKVEEAGGKNISIKYVPFDTEGLPGTFDVRYHDAQGLYRVRRCIVRMTYSNDQIYWVNKELM
jgi:hypothetical protein